MIIDNHATVNMYYCTDKIGLNMYIDYSLDV